MWPRLSLRRQKRAPLSILHGRRSSFSWTCSAVEPSSFLLYGKQWWILNFITTKHISLKSKFAGRCSLIDEIGGTNFAWRVDAYSLLSYMILLIMHASCLTGPYDICKRLPKQTERLPSTLANLKYSDTFISWWVLACLKIFMDIIYASHLFIFLSLLSIIQMFFSYLTDCVLHILHTNHSLLIEGKYCDTFHLIGKISLDISPLG